MGPRGDRPERDLCVSQEAKRVYIYKEPAPSSALGMSGPHSPAISHIVYRPPAPCRRPIHPPTRPTNPPSKPRLRPHHPTSAPTPSSTPTARSPLLPTHRLQHLAM